MILHVTLNVSLWFMEFRVSSTTSSNSRTGAQAGGWLLERAGKKASGELQGCG